jgi:hypothetical protein
MLARVSLLVVALVLASRAARAATPRDPTARLAVASLRRFAGECSPATPAGRYVVPASPRPPPDSPVNRATRARAPMDATS